MAHLPASALQAPSKNRKRTPAPSTIPKSPPTRTTLTPFHFARLTAKWELDRRIPSPASRAAWAAARGLDPVKGSYEMDVGDVEAEEEEGRKAREEKAKRGVVRVKREEEGEVEMGKGEEEGEAEAHVGIPPQTGLVPTSVHVLMEVDEQMKTGEQDTPIPSTITPSPPPTLPSSPISTSSPLTLSQCFLPPSSPYTSPPPRSAPSPPASPPRFTPAHTGLQASVYPCVGLCAGVRFDQAGRSSLPMLTALCRCESRLLVLVPRLAVPPSVGGRAPSAESKSKYSTKQPKKIAHRPAKAVIIPPKTSKPWPSRKRPKTPPPPSLDPPAAPVAPRPSPPPPQAVSGYPSTRVTSARTQALADIQVNSHRSSSRHRHRHRYQNRFRRLHTDAR
ncbi:hypothetical protein D9611_012191 [Ephemerocybe angulata]|uniref:Uncharacterized protein n=1 Tax=Ephemerocybe angulata TaxID=980116 RepID=A0A8H5C7M0_9AGAR|nr:hypothetical protein D9611_012191 [Tulosesus angulatus]